VPAVNKHLKNIFDSGELTRAATISKMETVRAEGRATWSSNPDATVAVGYWVNSY
jgi:hypothetical protein